MALERGDGTHQAWLEEDLAATVRPLSGNYPVWVGWGLLDSLGERAKAVVNPNVVCIVSDDAVQAETHRARQSMERAGISTDMLFIPSGEQSKTIETLQIIYNWLAEREDGHKFLLLGIGGGVIGDLVGLVAATFNRGVPFALVPTTLLAMMDAAIGGKNAVNLPKAKNLVGTIYQPRFVVADTEILQTLPQRELTSGWVEALKHGLILDVDLLGAFESQRKAIMALEREAMTDVIRRSVAIKARVVSQDEHETRGIRVLLNYGHTIGHAIEAATKYERFLHGEAVSIGMMGAAYIGHALGMLSGDDVKRQQTVLEAYGLPLSCPGLEVRAILQAMRSDKKRIGTTLRWVLLDGVGNAVVRDDIPDELVAETLRRLVNP